MFNIDEFGQFLLDFLLEFALGVVNLFHWVFNISDIVCIVYGLMGDLVFEPAVPLALLLLLPNYLRILVFQLFNLSS